jgi:hypothetical protein
MQNIMKNKLVTSLIVVATVILAAVAVFTALRLYQLRSESISPTGPEESKAWDCSKYTFNVNDSGEVTVSNNSSRSEPPQQANVYINEQLVATFDVPALPEGQSATLGQLSVPGGTFNWRVAGTVDCVSAGSSGQALKACTSLAFNFTEPSATPTNTPTPTATATPTGSPTNTPTGTITITPTESPGDEPTLTPTSVSTSTPTSTSTLTPTSGGEISAVSPTPGGVILPDAGISTPTIIAGLFGIILILFALILAL